MKRLLLGAAVAALVTAIGCSRGVRGSGVIKIEQRETAAVTSVDVSGAYAVDIVAQKEPRLELEGDDNILPLVHTDIVDGKLIISSDEKFNVKNPIKVRIATQTLRGVSVSGANQVAVHAVNVERFDLRSSGASKIDAEGQATLVSINSSGADEVEAKNLQSKRASVSTSGASSITVHATDELNVEASGAGNVTYYGNPMVVHQNASGAASVKKGS